MNIVSPSHAQLDCLLKHYQIGDYGEAEKIAIFLTKQFPKHQFSWKVLGALLKQTGRCSWSSGDYVSMPIKYYNNEDNNTHQYLS